jgi:hypothetical protein
MFDASQFSYLLIKRPCSGSVSPSKLQGLFISSQVILKPKIFNQHPAKNPAILAG